MMKTKMLLVLVMLLSFNAFADELKTVPYVDVSRYLGNWYQIARNPMQFENGCVCSRQNLSVRAEGGVAVYNTCNRDSANGNLMEIRGVATSDDPVSNAKFTVDFNLPFKGKYWVIGVDSDYRWAVVSEPSKKALYILSKTPTLAADLKEAALAKAAEQVDTSKLYFTPQLGCTYPAFLPL